MRMSCNGCRVLRKGCSDSCTIRPCLQWIRTPEAQANATVFLAKFYGRAGLLNLLAAPGPGADHLRPAVFRSLLYEACGRIINPVYGSVGLLWSGQWQACQAAVEAVLKGKPLVRVAAAQSEEEAAETPPLGTRAACDIRHVAKDLRVSRAGRTRFKRASSSSTTSKTRNAGKPDDSKRAWTPTQQQEPVDDDARVPSDQNNEESSAGSHQHLEDHDMAAAQEGSSEDIEAEEAGSHVSQAEEPPSRQDEDEVRLELTLGLEPLVRRHTPLPSCDLKGLSAASSLMGLRLELPA